MERVGINLDVIKTVSRRSEVFTSFRGPLIQFPIVRSIDRNTGILRRWIVFSQGKRSTLVRYLWGKFLWDELNRLEALIFWSLDEITKDTSIYLSLKAINTCGTPKRLVRKRLESGAFLGFTFISRQQYLSIKGRVNYFFLEETITLQKTPKYSGYTKHYKDKGSLGKERDYYISEILDPIDNVSEEIRLSFLTVGKVPLFGGTASYPDELKRKRNSQNDD